MKSYGVAIAVLTGTCALALGVRVIHSQGKASPGTVQVHLVVTDQGLNDTNEIPVLRAEDIQVKQGKNVLKVEQLIPARDDNAAFRSEERRVGKECRWRRSQNHYKEQ